MPMDKPTANRYRGDFIAWGGVCGFIGEGGGGPIAPHSHYAIQLALAAPAGLKVQFGRDGPWQPCAAALMPSRATHSIDVAGCEFSVVLFIEPETPVGRALAARLQGNMELLDAQVVAPCAALLDKAWRVDASFEGVQAACNGLLQQLSDTESPVPSDVRVL